MSIIFFTVGETAQVGEAPRRNKLIVSDNLTTLSTPGYLNSTNTSGKQIFPTDVFDVTYNYTSTSNFSSASAYGTGNYALCTVVISKGIISLIPMIANSSFLYANVPMSLANFTGMYGTPFNIIPSPGAGNVIVLERAMIYQKYGSAALTAGGVVAFQYGNTVHGAGVLASNSEQASDFTGATANQMYWFEGNSGNGSNGGDQSNTGIYLSNTSAAFATGTGSTFNVHVWYSVVTTP